MWRLKWWARGVPKGVGWPLKARAIRAIRAIRAVSPGQLGVRTSISPASRAERAERAERVAGLGWGRGGGRVLGRGRLVLWVLPRIILP